MGLPSTRHALWLWLWLRDSECGTLIHVQPKFDALLAPAFERAAAEERSCYKQGRDLSGYEDGTKNPRAMTLPRWPR